MSGTRSVVNSNPVVPSSGMIKFSDIKTAFNGKHSSLSALRGKHPSIPISGTVGFSFFRGIKAQDPNVTLVAVAGTNITMDASGNITGRVTSGAPGSITIDFSSMDPNSPYNGTVTYSNIGALPTGGLLSTNGVMTLSNLVAAYAASINIQVTNFYSSCLTFPITFALTSNFLNTGITSCVMSFFMAEFAYSQFAHVLGSTYKGHAPNHYAPNEASTQVTRYQSDTTFPCKTLAVASYFDLGGTSGLASAAMNSIPYQNECNAYGAYLSSDYTQITCFPYAMIDMRCSAPCTVKWASSGGMSIMLMVGLGSGQSTDNTFARAFQFGPFDIYTRTNPGNGGYQKTFCVFPKGYRGPWFQDYPPNQASWGISYRVQDAAWMNNANGIAVLTYDNATSTAKLYYGGVLQGSQVYSGITPVDFTVTNLVIPSWGYDAPVWYYSTIRVFGVAAYNGCLNQSQVDFMNNYYNSTTDANFLVNSPLNEEVSSTPGKRYPPKGLTSNTTTISGQVYGNGTYVTSCSDFMPFSNPSNGQPFNAWDGALHRTPLLGNVDLPGFFYYHSLDNYTGVSGGFVNSYTGANTVSQGKALAQTIVSGTTYGGDWIQIACPQAVSLIGYWLVTGAIGTGKYDGNWVHQAFPSRWILAGSNDGNTWTTIHFQDAFLGMDLMPDCKYVALNNIPSYSFFRLVVLNVGAYSNFLIEQMIFQI